MNFTKIFACAIFLTAGLALQAQSTPVVTRIAVVDLQTVFNSTSQHSPSMQRLEELRVRLEEDIRSRQEAIQLLIEQRTEANLEGNTREVNNLNRQITQRENELQQFHQNAQRQLDSARAAVQVDDEHRNIIHRAIINIANRAGYSLVIANGGNILYWSPQVDITADVINLVNSMLN
ncbi:MAG: OmpH family outer membrane protein [Spirochaetaceae bacterium]|nr:OmpH family outer membrane protein [Spirochaetaceae bacterium]